MLTLAKIRCNTRAALAPHTPIPENICHPGQKTCPIVTMPPNSFGACTGEVKPCNGLVPCKDGCNGLDDDCDNLIDGMTQSCYVVAGNPYNADPMSYQNGVCHTGTWKCTAVKNSGVPDWGNGGQAAA